MEYTEVDIRLYNDFNPFADILVAKLNEVDFESYVEYEKGIRAYIQTNLFNKDLVKEIITGVAESTKLSYTITKIRKENWNANWESSLEPVDINDECVIRAHFHDSFPNKKYELIITPKMSFGTGHHETTSLMMNEMFNIDFRNKSVLDIGSGTGVLTILSDKLGGKKSIGLDIDQWAFENAIENSELNNTLNVKFIQGKINKVKDKRFDIILANINRNTIINDIELYVGIMSDNAKLLLSGFLKEDIPLIVEKAERKGLKLVCSKNNNQWQMLHLVRS